MPKKKSNKPSEYFTKTVDEAVKNKKTFAAGDNVKILPSSAKFPVMTGIICQLIHGNHGAGRIFAKVKLSDGRMSNVPLGRLSKLP